MGSFTQSAFADLPPSSENEQFVLTKEYEADRYDKKVNLAIEEYKDRNGEIWVLPVVRQVCIVVNLRQIVVLTAL